jgi:predicted RNase H-like HicB family nuclease
MREYAVVYEKTDKGWDVYCPDLPDVAFSGSTFEEAQTKLREGLEFQLESMLEDDEPIPEPTTRVETIKTDIVEKWPQRLPKSA